MIKLVLPSKVFLVRRGVPRGVPAGSWGVHGVARERRPEGGSIPRRIRGLQTSLGVRGRSRGAPGGSGVLSGSLSVPVSVRVSLGARRGPGARARWREKGAQSGNSLTQSVNDEEEKERKREAAAGKQGRETHAHTRGPGLAWWAARNERTSAARLANSHE